MPTSPMLLETDRGSMRVEHDLLGGLAVPADAYYGVQTARALDNFQITGTPLSHFPNFVLAQTTSWAFFPKDWRLPSRRPTMR